LKRTIRVFVVDESASSLESICNELESQQEIEIIGTAKSGFELTDKAFGSQPDLIIIGLHRPRMTGLEFIASLRERLLDTKFIVVTDPGSSVKAGLRETSTNEGSLVGGISRENLLRGIQTFFPATYSEVIDSDSESLENLPTGRGKISNGGVHC
jgi:DNA-binding NarL/FixJ family response regulator